MWAVSLIEQYKAQVNIQIITGFIALTLYVWAAFVAADNHRGIPAPVRPALISNM